MTAKSAVENLLGHRLAADATQPCEAIPDRRPLGDVFKAFTPERGVCQQVLDSKIVPATAV